MSVNTVPFEQCATILTSLYKQATGRDVVVSTEPDFVSVATTLLTVKKDIIYDAINEVLARTIFAIRPYEARFKGLEKDLPTWGGYMRKLYVVDDDWAANPAYAWPVAHDANQTPPSGNGQSFDQFQIRKNDIVETYFMGQSVFGDKYTVWDNQLEPNFRGSAEMGSFFAMLATHMNNKIESAKDALSSGLISNLIGSLLAENSADRVVHLLTEYNTLTGSQFTATTIRLPGNWNPFLKWVYGRIAALANKFKARSIKWQTTITGKPVPRHTPYEKQKLYILDDDRYMMEAQVLADTFHDNYLSLADVESVPYWQGIDTPDKVIVKPSYTGANGSIVTPQSAITKDGIFALLFDEDAIGWAMVHQNVAPARNVAGEYTTYWYNMTMRCFQDNTEKAVVFLLD